MNNLPKNEKFYTAHGKTQNMTAWAEEYGIHLSALSIRINKRGMSLEEALALGPARSKAPVRMLSARGQTKPLAEWALECGIQPGTLYDRLKRGIDPETALTPGRLPARRPATAPKKRRNYHAARREQLRRDLIARAVVAKAAEGVKPFVKLLATVDAHIAKGGANHEN